MLLWQLKPPYAVYADIDFALKPVLGRPWSQHEGELALVPCQANVVKRQGRARLDARAKQYFTFADL